MAPYNDQDQEMPSIAEIIERARQRRAMRGPARRQQGPGARPTAPPGSPSMAGQPSGGGQMMGAGGGMGQSPPLAQLAMRGRVGQPQVMGGPGAPPMQMDPMRIPVGQAGGPRVGEPQIMGQPGAPPVQMPPMSVPVGGGDQQLRQLVQQNPMVRQAGQVAQQQGGPGPGQRPAQMPALTRAGIQQMLEEGRIDQRMAQMLMARAPA